MKKRCKRKERERERNMNGLTGKSKRPGGVFIRLSIGRRRENEKLASGGE